MPSDPSRGPSREPSRQAAREPSREPSGERSAAPSGRRPPKEEPDFVNEADLPTEDQAPERGAKAPAGRQSGGQAAGAASQSGADAKPNANANPNPNPNPDVRTPPNADVAGVESAAGEEDPGAALDSPPNPRSPA